MLVLTQRFSSGALHGMWSLIILIVVHIDAHATDKSLAIYAENSPPYSMLDPQTQQMRGLWVETVQAVLKRMNQPYEDIQAIPWARLQRMGLSGEIDGLFGAQFNAERAKYMHFIDEPLTTDQWVFWIRKTDQERLKFETLDDLKGKSIGLIKDYKYPQEFLDYVEQFSTVSTVVYERQNFEMLAKGRIDFTVTLLHLGNWMIANEPFASELMPLTKKPLFTSEFFLLMNKQSVSQEWVQDFSTTLKSFKATDEYRALSKYYTTEYHR